MKLAAVSNKIIVEPISAEEKELKSGLILPDSIKQDGENGRIIATGPDVDSRLREGTKVMFHPASGAKIQTEARKMIIMRDIDLMFFYDDSPEAVSA